MVACKKHSLGCRYVVTSMVIYGKLDVSFENQGCFCFHSYELHLRVSINLHQSIPFAHISFKASCTFPANASSSTLTSGESVPHGQSHNFQCIAGFLPEDMIYSSCDDGILTPVINCTQESG